jgi:hypothetical protein
MSRTCTWLLALASLLGIAGTTHADLPALTPLFLPQLFGQEIAQPAPRESASPVPYQRLDFGFPIIRANGVVPSTAAVQSAPVPGPDRTAVQDEDWLCDLFWDCVDVAIDFAPEVRMFIAQLRPATPYHLAAAAVIEYLSAMDAAQRASSAASEPVAQAPACARSAPCGACEVLPYPKQVNTGSFQFGVGYNTTSGVVTSFGCTKAGVGCGTYAVAPVLDVADACDNDDFPCCDKLQLTGGSGKACKCCEDCADCKDCNCKKTTTAVVKGPGCVLSKEPLQADRVIVIGPHSGLPVALPPLPPPPPHAMMPIGFPLPPPPPPYPMMQHAMMPHCMMPNAMMPHCMMPNAMMPHCMMPQLPSSPLHELAELNWQRAIISAAIQQIEHELAQIECEQRVIAHVQPVPVAPVAQKVHMVTDHFEAHCDTVSCVGGDPHRLMLQGDVHLTCKKSGHTVRVEAPRVVINLKDGTFHVDGCTSIAPAPAAQGVMRYQPMPPAVTWTTGLNLECVPVPIDAGFVPVMPTRSGWQRMPEPCQPPCPSIPQAAPVPQRVYGDK